jgi:hypothetical protein
MWNLSTYRHVQRRVFTTKVPARGDSPFKLRSFLETICLRYVCRSTSSEHVRPLLAPRKSSDVIGSGIDMLRPFHRINIWRRALLLYDWLHELHNILIHTFLVAAKFEKSARCMRASDLNPTEPPQSQNANEQGQCASSKQGVGAKFTTSFRVVETIHNFSWR